MALQDRSPEYQAIVADLRTLKVDLEAELKKITETIEILDPPPVENIDLPLDELIEIVTPQILSYIQREAPPAKKGKTQLWVTNQSISLELDIGVDLVRRTVRKLKARGDIQTKANNRWVAMAPLREARIKVGEGQIA